METRRGRPPSAAKPGLFTSTGQVITKQQKRSSSKSSLFRRLNMSTTSLTNGSSVGDGSGGGGSSAVDRERRASAEPPLSPSGGKMSFRKHFQRTKTKIFGSNGSTVPGSGGGGTVNAPMLNGGDAAAATNGIPTGGDDSENDDDSGSDTDDDISATNNGSPEPTAADSPVTTTGAASVRTGSFPKTDGRATAAAASLVGGADGGGNIAAQQQTQPPQPVQPVQPPTPTTFTVPAPPPPVPQKGPDPTNKAAPPAVPPKIPDPPPRPGAAKSPSTSSTASVQSLQAVQRAQQQTAASGGGGGGGLLGGLKKLRRTDSKRVGSKGPTSAPLQGNSSNNGITIIAAPTTATTPTTAAGVVSVSTPPSARPGSGAPSHTKTATPGQAPALSQSASQQALPPPPPQATMLPPPPPPIQSSGGSRGVDVNGVPSSLRPGGGGIQVVSMQAPPCDHIPQQTAVEQQQQQLQQLQQQHQLQHQQQQQQQQQQIPCASCKAYYEAAWAQSEINLYALSSQLAAAHQQSAGQVALLHERDAQIGELSALVERLRTRIQEQVKQLEQLPAGGLPALGINHLSLNGNAAAGVGQLPDGQIRSRWKGLRWQIRQCVEARLAALPSSAAAAIPVSPERAPFLRRLTPDYDRFLHSRTGSVHLVEAAIWAVLADAVFSGARHSSRMCWAARWSNALAKINDNMLYSRPADPAFHQWRAQTAVFVRGLDDASADGGERQQQQQAAVVAAPYVEAVVRQLEAEVGVLLALGKGGGGGGGGSGGDDSSHSHSHSRSPSRSGSGTGGSGSGTGGGSDAAALRRQLFDVVAEAIGLDADLCQQRAWFYVHYPTSTSGQRYGMAFDAREMETVSASSRESDSAAAAAAVADFSSSSGAGVDDISLVIRPALFKAGTSRGEGYDQAQPIEPSIVCRTAPSRGVMRWAGARHDRSRSRG